METQGAASKTNIAMWRTFQKQKKAFSLTSYPEISLRKQYLRTLGSLILAHRKSFAEAIERDFGRRCWQETEMLEILQCLDSVKYAVKSLQCWARPQKRPASFWMLPAHTEILPQPLGVIGIMVPWNYPILLAIGPLVAALAAGNRVMIKMSELTPETAVALKMALSSCFDENHIAVVMGDQSVSKAFAALPWDHLLFTGSTSTGHHIMHAASENLTPVTLELGGKSPAWIAPGISLRETVAKIAFGKFVNAGQTCVAPDYVLLPEEQLSPFVQQMKAEVSARYPSPSTNRHYTSIINDQHYARLQALLKDAESKGAEVVSLGGKHSIDDPQNRRLSPRFLLNANDSMQVMQQEIFGPILPILSYKNHSEAQSFIQNRPRPLALYYFDQDRQRTHRVLKETMAGGVTVNDTLLHLSQSHLPFGGVGLSGMGHYHGKYGFDTFSKLKPIFYQACWSGSKLVRPPYGRTFKLLLQMMTR